MWQLGLEVDRAQLQEWLVGAQRVVGRAGYYAHCLLARRRRAHHVFIGAYHDARAATNVTIHMNFQPPLPEILDEIVVVLSRKIGPGSQPVRCNARLHTTVLRRLLTPRFVLLATAHSVCDARAWLHRRRRHPGGYGHETHAQGCVRGGNRVPGWPSVYRGRRHLLVATCRTPCAQHNISLLNYFPCLARGAGGCRCASDCSHAAHETDVPRHATMPQVTCTCVLGGVPHNTRSTVAPTGVGAGTRYPHGATTAAVLAVR